MDDPSRLGKTSPSPPPGAERLGEVGARGYRSPLPHIPAPGDPSFAVARAVACPTSPGLSAPEGRRGEEQGPSVAASR